MLPDMSDVLRSWERTIIVKTVSRATVNFVETDTAVFRNQLIVVQVAEKEALNSVTINWSLQYIQLHTREALELEELVQFDGKDYKVIQGGDWNGYGYIECVAEETGRPLVTETVVP